MKKRNFLLVLLFLMIASTPLFAVSCKKQRVFKSASLYLNDSFVTNKNIYISSDGIAKFSLLEIFKCLNFSIEPQENNSIKIIYNEKEYYLNITEKAFYRKGETNNLIIIPPGSEVFSIEVIDGDLIVQAGGIVTLLQMEFDISIKYTCDKENLRVNIYADHLK